MRFYLCCSLTRLRASPSTGPTVPSFWTVNIVWSNSSGAPSNGDIYFKWDMILEDVREINMDLKKRKILLSICINCYNFRNFHILQMQIDRARHSDTPTFLVTAKINLCQYQQLLLIHSPFIYYNFSQKIYLHQNSTSAIIGETSFSYTLEASIKLDYPTLWSSSWWLFVKQEYQIIQSAHWFVAIFNVNKS